MSKLIGSEQQLNKQLKHGTGVMVLFYSQWCMFSQLFLPVFEKHARTSDFCRVLVEEVEGAIDKYSIETTPTVLFFKDGKVTKRLDGEPGVGLNEEQLTEMESSCGLLEPAGASHGT